MKPQSPHRPRSGWWIWILVVFVFSYWIGLVTLFFAFGFNPGGNELRELKWRASLFLWTALMLVLLAYSVVYWRNARHRTAWIATLVLMGTCSLWYPILFGTLLNGIAACVR